MLLRHASSLVVLALAGVALVTVACVNITTPDDDESSEDRLSDCPDRATQPPAYGYRPTHPPPNPYPYPYPYYGYGCACYGYRYGWRP
jgi:hypothetical protein